VSDLKGNFAVLDVFAYLPHYENAFRNANILASHKLDSYNRFHRLQQFATSAVSSTSSFGGLNPNRSFGFFFALRLHALVEITLDFWRAEGAKWPPSHRVSTARRHKSPHVLTCRRKFLYNSGLFRIRARGGRTRESLHAPRCAHYKQEKTHWAQQFFWIDHEDVFRKSP
jgi:hypothetical protein